MNFLDILFLTLVSTIACVAFPRLISVILTSLTKLIAPQCEAIAINTKNNITSFPYCTAYALTKTPLCKFSPRFCEQCSVL